MELSHRIVAAETIGGTVTCQSEKLRDACRRVPEPRRHRWLSVGGVRQVASMWLVSAPLPLCEGASFLLCFQRTTVAEWIFVVASPLSQVQSEHAWWALPRIDRYAEHGRARRGLLLPLLEAASSAAPCTPINFTSALSSFDCVTRRCFFFCAARFFCAASFSVDWCTRR